MNSTKVWYTQGCVTVFYQTTLPVSWEACGQVKKQQLESDIE